MIVEKQPKNITSRLDDVETYLKMKKICKSKGLKVGWVVSRLIEVYIKNPDLIKE